MLGRRLVLRDDPATRPMDGAVPAAPSTRLLDDRTTHGICEQCIRKLERDGASRLVEP